MTNLPVAVCKQKVHVRMQFLQMHELRQLLYNIHCGGKG